MKTSWPELVGVVAAVAESTIRKERPDVTVQVIPSDGIMTMDYRTNRVRILVETSTNKVVSTPQIG